MNLQKEVKGSNSELYLNPKAYIFLLVEKEFCQFALLRDNKAGGGLWMDGMDGCIV